MLGKKLYTTSMLNTFRLVILCVAIFFFHNFYLETFTYEKFQTFGRFRFLDVFDYHLKYPTEFVTFFVITIIPATYYGIIRGVRFYEKGFIFNRGIPFLNRTILYSDISLYKLLHPQKAISIHTHDGNIFVIADNNVERVIAILDQHNIKGDLAQDDFVKLISNYKKFILIVLGFSVFIFVIKKIGLFQ